MSLGTQKWRQELLFLSHEVFCSGIAVCGAGLLCLGIVVGVVGLSVCRDGHL